MRLTIGVDFDGTIVAHRFPEIGLEFACAIRVLREIKSRGHDIILFTCREDYDRKYLTEAVEWLHSRGVTVDAVNENSPYWKSKGYTSRKPFWDLLIDDSAGFNPENWPTVMDLVKGLERGISLAKYDGNG